jgi:hypothetical protein
MDPIGNPETPPPEPAPAASHRFVPPPLLPAPGEYLRSLIRLGLASLRPALPALILLFVYRIGMGLYLIFTGDATSSLGFPDEQARILTAMVTAAAYLPLLVLVYTPFLPLQDGLLAGRRRSFPECVKQVLELLPPFGASGVVQVLIIMVPACAVIVGAALFATPLTAGSPDARGLLIVAAMLPAFLWVSVALLFLAFAAPLLLLDGRGPLASIRESARLVRANFAGVLGRFFLFGLVFVLAAMFLTFPNSMLAAVSAVARARFLGAEIAGLVWASAIGAFLFPFSVSALLILYRALLPARAAEPGPAAIAETAEPTPTANPYRFE